MNHQQLPLPYPNSKLKPNMERSSSNIKHHLTTKKLEIFPIEMLLRFQHLPLESSNTHE